jgi:hypothetical protein
MESAMFDAAAKFQEMFDQPLGEIYKSAGVITNEQFVKSGQVQAELLAIRNSVYDEHGHPDQARVDMLPVFKGKADLGLLITDKQAREDLRHLLEIPVTTFLDANRTVAFKEGVNPDPATIQVPLIGLIHEKLHDIPASTKDAALSAQSLGRLMGQLERLTKTGADPSKTNERVFCSDKDSKILQDLQKSREILLAYEKNMPAGETISLYDLPTVPIGASLSELGNMLTDAFPGLITPSNQELIDAALYQSGAMLLKAVDSQPHSAPKPPSGP